MDDQETEGDNGGTRIQNSVCTGAATRQDESWYYLRSAVDSTRDADGGD